MAGAQGTVRAPVEAERRRFVVEEQERVRRAEESRIHWEKARPRWAEDDAPRAREKGRSVHGVPVRHLNAMASITWR